MTERDALYKSKLLRVERLLQITLIVVISSWEQINIESNDFFIVIMDKLDCSSFRIQKQIVICDVMRNLVLFHNPTIWFYCWYEYMYSLNVDIYKWIISFVCSFSTNIYIIVLKHEWVIIQWDNQTL